MSRKKGEQILQIEINTSAQFEECISKEGLVVVDVYQEWTGHTKTIESLFKKMRMELGDPLLRFAIANVDKIPELENYRGKCEPCFLFYASKNLVAVVRGANAPVIIKTITEQLAYEHKCMVGEAQRKPITDTVVMHQAEVRAASSRSRKTIGEKPAEKPVTICVIKPDIMLEKKQYEVIAKIEEKGYEIVESKVITFTDRMAREFYDHQKELENFEELITYMTSGPSMVLALRTETGDIVESWRADMGPVDIEEAKHTPETLRAQFAESNLKNALHGSDSHESAARDLAFFFPKGLGHSQKGTQRTIALIRPSALNKNKDEIIEKIKASGFTIAMSKTVQLDKEGAEEFYAEQEEQHFFDDLVQEMTSGPMMVLCLVKEDAVAEWRNNLGPKEKDNIKNATGTFRQEFDIEGVPINSLHGASTPGQAEKELAKFFPMEQTVALLKPGLTDEQKSEITKKIEDSGFIIATKKSEKLTEEIAREMYKGSEELQHFENLVALMTSGETEILVLSRENAIQGWREEIGDADPAVAKETHPNSLRAVYGVDVLNNGVHGASTKEQVDNELKLFGLGETKSNESG